jgi:two-component system nitrogen regulation sensor histidine kinase GlnL
VLGLSRRSMSRTPFFDWFADPQVLRETVAAVSNNAFSTSRLEGGVEAPSASHGECCRCT